MQYIPSVTDVKFGRSEKAYIVPEMAEILDETYGKPIYQEQIQKIFANIAGFDLGTADIIRRAMSKKHLDEIEAAKDQFVAGMKAKGGMDEEIEKFWQELLEFAKYAFNKSHAAAYSVVSYYTAWLKYYYPAEYISALMSHSDNSQFDMYINDAKYFDVEVLPPDVNASFEDFVPELFNGKKAIRFGLSSIKGMGVNAKGFVEERRVNGKYNSYSELVARCVLAGIQKKALYLAVQAGATECLGGNYNMHLKNAEFAHEAAKKELAKMLKKEPEMAYDAQLEALVSFIDGILVNYEDMLAGVKARMMKECLGTYLSNSPLEGIKLPTQDITFVQDMTVDGAKVKAAGYIDDITVLARKSDGAPMAKFTFGDNTGSISAICFTTSYANNKAQISEGNVVIAKGRLKVETDESGETSSVDFIISDIEAVKQ
jgi:DNA polymerase-3 subunit alpha